VKHQNLGIMFYADLYEKQGKRFLLIYIVREKESLGHSSVSYRDLIRYRSPLFD
jgi:hypothetical protein